MCSVIYYPEKLGKSLDSASPAECWVHFVLQIYLFAIVFFHIMCSQPFKGQSMLLPTMLMENVIDF